MILQTVILPSEICEEETLYFRRIGNNSGKDSIYYENGCLCLKSGGEITTDTYMNLFDAAQWRKYTDITDIDWLAHICYEGDADIRVVEAGEKFFIHMKALSDLRIIYIRFETYDAEEEDRKEDRKEDRSAQELKNDAGSKTGAHHLYLSAQDAVNEEPGKDL